MSRSKDIESFYVSRKWKKCRTAFANSKGNMCEHCLAKGIIEAGSKDRPLEVHHKIPLNDSNIQNPEITLNWDNLELLCKTCHDMERERKNGKKRWKVTKDGKVHI